MENEKKEKESLARIRTYSPQTDFEAVKANLQEANMYDDVLDAKNKLQRLSQDNPSAILVATINDSVVGSVFQSDRLYPYLWRLVVKKDFREKGIGEELLDEVLKRLKENGHTEIGIFVDEGHEDIKNWYLKRGFKPTGLYRAMWKQI